MGLRTSASVLKASCLFFLYFFLFTAGSVNAQRCPLTLVRNPNPQTCDASGVLLRPRQLGPAFTSNSNDYTHCRDACFANVACTTFSFTSSRRQCRLYRGDLSSQRFIRLPRRWSPPSFWSRRCFTVPISCLSSTPAATASTTSAAALVTENNSASEPANISPSEPVSLPSGATPSPEAPSAPAAVVVPPGFTRTYTYEEGILPTFTSSPAYEDDPNAVTQIPPAPSPGQICFFEAGDESQSFRLLSPSAVPLIPKGGNIVRFSRDDVPANVEQNGYTPPEYSFSNLGGFPGLYDIVTRGADGTTLYLAFDLSSGKVVTIRDGPSFGGNLPTTIFSVTCEGRIQITIDGFPYVWLTDAADFITTMREGPPNEDGSDSVIALPKLSNHSIKRSLRKRGLAQQGRAPRCPPSSNNIDAVVATFARPKQANGCGNGGLSRVLPQFTFGQCCNDHDYCFDDCERGFFEGCNSVFLDCMSNSCKSISWFRDPVYRINCEIAAPLYFLAVSSSFGVDAFKEASTFDETKRPQDTGRCECVCANQLGFCNGNCIQLKGTDSSNCGKCGRQCGPGRACRGGECVCVIDTRFDDNNCGGCGNKCPFATHCDSSRCVCNKNTCGNKCVDFQTHPRHCGRCDNACETGYCYQGQCVSAEALAASDICFPGEAVRNGDFESEYEYWASENSAVNYPQDYGTKIVGEGDPPNKKMAMNYVGQMTQNIAVCPGTAYQVSLSVRRFVASNGGANAWPTCRFEVLVSGQSLGQWNPSAGVAVGFNWNYVYDANWVQLGPFPIAAFPPGTGTATIDDAPYYGAAYDSRGKYAFTQLTLRLICSGARQQFNGIIVMDDVSIVPAQN